MSRPYTQLELRAVPGDGGHVCLMSPEVGNFTGALPKGAALAPGMVAGSLQRLGVCIDLIVPEGAGGAVLNDPPRARISAVGFGDQLYEVDPAGAAATAAPAADDASAEGGLTVRASQSGRVWHSPSPGDPPFCGPGAALVDGSPLCLIEVMKTFSTVPYRAEKGLPARSKVVRWVAADGDDVEPGSPLLIIEPA